MQGPSNRALPAGYQLLDYTIENVISGGGFSFVYLAKDKQGDKVAIKEYLPPTLALRVDGDKVEPSTPGNLSAFRHGLKCFFEEGKSLATIDHDNIIHVENFFRANNTVYMVMDYEPGKSLQDFIRGRAQPLRESFVRSIFSKLQNGLREVHARKLLHLDIKPANIHIRTDGSPVLLDFGSARQALTNTQSSLSASYTPGFAAPEQYFDREHLGPWSDIYSVGASMYACLVRGSPVSADIRSKHDTLVSAVQVGEGIYSERLLEIIDWCMQLDPMKRPPSVFALQKALIESIPRKPAKRSLLASIRKKLSGRGGR